jgi:hypothetical protein
MHSENELEKKNRKELNAKTPRRNDARGRKEGETTLPRFLFFVFFASLRLGVFALSSFELISKLTGLAGDHFTRSLSVSICGRYALTLISRAFED